MLLDSPRLTDDDRRVWAALELQDARRARSIGWRIAQAQERIRRFVERRPDAWVAVSWGKDSVTVAHLARSVDPTIPLAHDGRGEWSSPEAVEVRDAYLSGWPMPYEEFDSPPTVQADGYTGWARKVWRTTEAMGPHRMSGVRAAESGQRALSAAVHGVATDRVCRPILDWPTADVFAYLHRFDLPIHPAYAMSGGGAWERDRLRVSPLFGRRGAEIGRREWERRYYPEHYARLRSRQGTPAPSRSPA